MALPLIVTRSDWLLSGPPILAAPAGRRGRYDAAVIAVFGDPAPGAAKQLLDVPVLGIRVLRADLQPVMRAGSRLA